MAIGRDIIGSLAKQFGYSKDLVRQALASNQIDPLTASLIGSRIDKMQQTKQQAASRTTVMEDVLAPKPEEVMSQGIAAVPQEAPTALAALPSNLPAEGMAGGGIVAFAEGGETPNMSGAPVQSAINVPVPKGYTFDAATGQYDPIVNQGGNFLAMLRGEEGPVARILELVRSGRGYAKGDLIKDEEDEEDELEAMEKSGLSKLMGGISSGLASLKGSVARGEGFSLPQSYEAALIERGQTPATIRKAAMQAPTRTETTMSSEERRPRGSHKYEADVVREAERIGLDPNLAVHVLYKETGGLKNPEAARSRAGALGVMQLMPRTAKELGVDPLNTEENIRGGVAYLKKMVDQFNDPTLALAAYNAGPGRVSQILRSGQGISALPRETQNYIRMADGGIVAFQNRGLVEPKGLEDLTPEEIEQMSKPFIGQRIFKPARLTELQQKALGEQQQRQMEQEDRAALPTPTTRTSFEPEPTPAPAPAAAPAPTSEIDINKLIGGAQGGEKDTGIMKKYMELLAGREKASADQRKTDAYLSLLSAGLGIMGGTSPFAAVNIGQGAQAGVATQMAARKAQIADERATLSGFGTAAAAEEAAKQRQLVAAQGRESKVGQLIAGREKQLETLASNNVQKNNINFMTLDAPQQQALLAREVQRLKSADPLLSKLYKEYGLPQIEAISIPAAPVDYGKTYGLTPKPTK